MSQSVLNHCRLAGVSTCVPSKVLDNVEDTKEFPRDAIKKVVSVAGVARRHVSEGGICSSDLCFKAAADLMDRLAWDKESVDGLIFVTQTPDYFLPSTSCVLHQRLEPCAHAGAYGRSSRIAESSFPHEFHGVQPYRESQFPKGKPVCSR